MDALETRQLCIRARQGSHTAREKLVRQHMGLVIRIAHHFYKPGAFIEWGDLIQQGCLGLLHAIAKYDPNRRSRGKWVQFATYAHYWICHSIRREIENHGRTVAVPVHKLKAVSHTVESIEERDLEDDTYTERFSDPKDTVEEWCRPLEARGWVDALLKKLPERAGKILQYRYGLGGKTEPMTQKQAGRRLGLDGTRVGQLERAALFQLQEQAYAFLQQI